ILAAQNAGNTRDVVKLETMRELIENGDMIVPRNYVRKYGFAARTINDNADYLEGFLFRPEYNLLDTLRLYTAAFKYQDALLAETMDNPLSDIVTEVKIPFYFLMGKYDCMTSPKAAQTYLDNLISQQEKEFVIFENSAHCPQFEERDVFYEWLCEKFLGEE
ncbi:MAG: alpha/beta hydrolase, partial [Lachnospiraceae bacterium]|nr:alpha/beta hydrolase [Lachnospiraceae bacterium]